jgi:thiamine-phosphate pyrophosphorylase
VTPPRLLACTPPVGPVDDGAVLRWRDAGALDLGLALWLREPGASPRELVVGRLRPLLWRARAAGVPVVLGIDADAIGEAAAVVEADGLAGVHLRGDPSRDALATARRSFALVGRSSHDASVGDHDLVDYTCFGPVFAPRTRIAGDDKRPQGLAALAACAEHDGAWVLAIGGVTGSDAPACIRAGARGLAGIAGFFSSPPAELAAWVTSLGRFPPSGTSAGGG